MSEIQVDTVAEKTSANGVTVDGLNIKDSKLVTANSVITSNITDANITTAKIADVNVTEGKIADNAITLAKMASGTDGNIISYDTSGNPVAVATGSSGQVLTSAGAGAIPSFQAAAGGGKLLQVVSVTWKDAFSSTAKDGTFAAITGASAAITPSATSSKILITVMLNSSGSVYGQYINLLKGGSVISGAQGAVSGSRVAMTAYAGTPNDAAEMDTTHINYLDSPSSTSAVTYSLSGSARSDTTWTVNYPYEDSNNAYIGHAVSTITLMEIGA